MTAPCQAPPPEGSPSGAAPAGAAGPEGRARRPRIALFTGAGAAGPEGRARRPRIALFMGAGASAAYDMPTTAGAMGELGAGFPRQDLLGRYPDIEHILQILDQEIKIARSKAGRHHRGINADLDAKLGRTKDAKRAIERLIRLRYKWRPSNDRTAERILGPLFDLARSDENDITVFTTNYDTAVEAYTERPDRRIDLVNGFKPHDAAHAHVWRDSFTPNRDLPARVYLYKLHGSMSWQRIDIGGRDEIAAKSDRSRSDLGSRDMYIRPSLDIKNEATKAEPYASILRRFKRELPSFDVCIVVGCSFRDEHLLGEFVEFVRHGGTLIAVSPTALADFMRALERPLPPDKAAGWGEKPLCSMNYRPGERQGFYAVHQRIGEDDMESVMDAVRGIVAGRRSSHFAGSIVEAVE